MKKLLLLLFCVFTITLSACNSTGGTKPTDSKKVEMVSDVIPGKSYEHLGGDGVMHINTFDKDCKTVVSHENGVKVGSYPVTCGEKAVFTMGSKTITYSMGWSGLTKSVDLGFKTVSFSPKEVPNPE